MLDLPVSDAPRKHTLTCVEGRKGRKGKEGEEGMKKKDRGEIG